MADDIENLKNFFENMYREVLEEFQIDKVQEYFSESYQQTVDGRSINYLQFIQHLEELSKRIESISILPFDEVIVEGNKIVLRYKIDAQNTGGKKISSLMIAIFEVQNGKIIRCWELSKTIRDNNRQTGSIIRLPLADDD